MQLASISGNEATFKVNTTEYPFPMQDPNYAWLTVFTLLLTYLFIGLF